MFEKYSIKELFTKLPLRLVKKAASNIHEKILNLKNIVIYTRQY